MRNQVFLELEKIKNLNTGLGQFCLHLGKEFEARDGENFDFTFFIPQNKKNLFKDSLRFKYPRVWQKLFFPFTENFHVWHCFHQDSKYWPASIKTKIIFTIHDLNFLYKNKSESYKKEKLESLQKKIDRADALTFISNHAFQEVKRNLHIEEKKSVSIIYNGNTLLNSNDIKPAFAPDEDYLFSIGFIQPKKNFHVLVPLLKHNPDLKLIIAGINSDSYVQDIKRYASECGVANKIILPGLVSDAEKSWLYKNCKAFLFPSISEGFGLPIVEAMSLGKPVFLSSLTSLPEVGGKEAYYWNSFDPDHMQMIFEAGMEDFASNQSEKEQRLIKWSQNFTWGAAAEKYLNLYREVINC
jgi:glycosyltransferase involved in cell wall biosynthesis